MQTKWLKTEFAKSKKISSSKSTENVLPEISVYSKKFYKFNVSKDNTKAVIGLHQKDTRIFRNDEKYHNYDTDLQLIILKLSPKGIEPYHISENYL